MPHQPARFRSRCLLGAVVKRLQGCQCGAHAYGFQRGAELIASTHPRRSESGPRLNGNTQALGREANNAAVAEDDAICLTARTREHGVYATLDLLNLQTLSA